MLKGMRISTHIKTSIAQWSATLGNQGKYVKCSLVQSLRSSSGHALHRKAACSLSFAQFEQRHEGFLIAKERLPLEMCQGLTWDRRVLMQSSCRGFVHTSVRSPR